MSKKDEALKLALEALEYIDRQDNDRDFLGPEECCDLDNAITALREALTEQPAQQEPFKWSIYEADGTHHNKPSQKQQQPLTWLKVIETPGGWGKFVEAKPHEKGAKPVYTSPQAHRTWVWLTDEEIDYLCELAYEGDEELILTVQAKLKEKNQCK